MKQKQVIEFAKENSQGTVLTVANIGTVHRLIFESCPPNTTVGKEMEIPPNYFTKEENLQDATVLVFHTPQSIDVVIKALNTLRDDMICKGSGFAMAC